MSSFLNILKTVCSKVWEQLKRFLSWMGVEIKIFYSYEKNKKTSKDSGIDNSNKDNSELSKVLESTNNDRNSNQDYNRRRSDSNDQNAEDCRYNRNSRSDGDNRRRNNLVQKDSESKK